MVVAGFAAPYLLDTTTRFVQAAATLPDVQLALITCEPADRLPPGLRDSLAGHWRIEDGLDVGQIAGAVQGLGDQLGPVQRLLAVLEQLQVPLAQVRDHLGIPGMDVVTAGNFRDKARMKTVLRAAGVPCARHRLARSATDAADFARLAGFPLVVKPPAGAGAKSTFPPRQCQRSKRLAGYISAEPGAARADRGVPDRGGGLLRQRDGRRADRLGLVLGLPADPA